MFHLFEEIGAVFCCKNDEYFTFKREFTIISAIVGYDRSELNHFIDIITPESRQAAYHCFKVQLSESRTSELLLEITHKEGHTIWVIIKVKLATLEAESEYKELLLEANIGNW